MPLPEDYDDFDAEAYDEETRRLERLVHERWLNDLRNLQSEEDAARQEAARSQEPPSPFPRLREAFEARDPRPAPDLDGDPRLHAEWEWRWLEFYYTETNQLRALARHHLDRGRFIEHWTGIQRRSQEEVGAILKPLRERPPREHVPEPWPPATGDGVALWRRKFDEVSDPEDLAEDLERRKTRAYAIKQDIQAAKIGWWRSLPKEAYELASPFNRTLGEISVKADSEGFHPAGIGDDLLGIKRALARTQDALDVLEGLRGYWWLTPPAYTVLRNLLEQLTEALLDRYLEVRTLYEGYLERARRLLTRDPASEA